MHPTGRRSIDHEQTSIARERERQGLSQAELARRLGHASHVHLSHVESGKKTPGLDMLFTAADALGVRVNRFFTEI